MASGDTKTEAMLNVLGNGGSGDEFRGCCNTKTQSYILDAIDRINNLDPSGGGGEFTTLKDSDANYSFDGTDYIALWLLPSGKYKLDEDATVELVPHLVEDAPTDTVSSESNPVAIITNEEESGGSADVLLLSSQSSFYTNVDYDTGVSNDFNFMNTEFSGTDGQSDGSAGLVPAPSSSDADKFLKSDGTWDVAGGSSSGVKFLTSADYNYPTDNPTAVNPGMLDPGIYFVEDETVNVFNGGNSQTNRHHLVFIISASDDVTGQNEMMVINDTVGASEGDYKINFYYTNVSTGVTIRRKGLLDETYVADNLTTNSSTKVLSAKQGRALNQKILAVQEGNTGGQTPTAIGSIGQVYIDTSSADAYMCTSTTGGVYTWKKITS